MGTRNIDDGVHTGGDRFAALTGVVTPVGEKVSFADAKKPNSVSHMY
jgi:hypothetical protein